MKIKRFLSGFIGLFLITSSVYAQFGEKGPGASRAGNGTPPQYQILDIGVVNQGDASQGLGVSAGGIAVGRSLGTGSDAFIWTQNGGLTGLPRLSGRTFCLSAGANDIGFVAGTCSNSFSGSGRLPVIWQNGIVSQLPLPNGETIGDANDINASGVAVGSINGGTLQRGVIYSGGTGAVISQTTSNGSFFVTAFGINDFGRIVGQGIDPNNAARNVGMVYDMGASNAIEVGALPNANGALAFGVSNTGFVVGSSMMNQGSGLPFIWSESSGITAIPLPTGTSQGSARGVNSAGWAVGTASSAFAIPFLYDGTNTYRLADLIPPGTGWDLSTNTSSSALGISDGNVIVGTGVLNGEIHAYALVPAPEVSVGGRIVRSTGNGIPRAFVTISGGNLQTPVTVLTATFGYYNFRGLQSGATYTVTVQSGRYTFAQPTQMITPQGDVGDLNFVAEQ
ncbi:MAG: carboxypeptidase regulatory-like domain-containing protein [Pyrinomonadaceae bacterium]